MVWVWAEIIAPAISAHTLHSRGGTAAEDSDAHARGVCSFLDATVGFLDNLIDRSRP